jgi:hypothetical protein
MPASRCAGTCGDASTNVFKTTNGGVTTDAGNGLPAHCLNGLALILGIRSSSTRHPAALAHSGRRTARRAGTHSRQACRTACPSVVIDSSGTSLHAGSRLGELNYEFAGDLWSTLTATSQSVTLGASITYTATFANDGPDERPASTPRSRSRLERAAPRSPQQEPDAALRRRSSASWNAATRRHGDREGHARRPHDPRHLHGHSTIHGNRIDPATTNDSATLNARSSDSSRRHDGTRRLGPLGCERRKRCAFHIIPGRARVAPGMVGTRRRLRRGELRRPRAHSRCEDGLPPLSPTTERYQRPDPHLHGQARNHGVLWSSSDRQVRQRIRMDG